MKNLTLPLWQMTGGDIIELLKENWGYITKTDTPQFCTTLTTQPNYVYGIAGLARKLNCSTPTIHKQKKAGAFDGCYWKDGRKYIFDFDAIMFKQIKPMNHAS